MQRCRIPTYPLFLCLQATGETKNSNIIGHIRTKIIIYVAEQIFLNLKIAHLISFRKLLRPKLIH
jgi:hypothetical protein